MLILGVLLIVLVAMVRLRRSPMGLAFNLVGVDRQAAAAVGISPLKFRVYAFTASGILAAVAGILANWMFRSPPSFVNYLSPYSLFLLAIPVLAGLDSIAYVVVVAVTFEVVPVVVESLRINAFLLGAAGLLVGALFGSRGFGGRGRRRLPISRPRQRANRLGEETLDALTLRSSAGLAGENLTRLSEAGARARPAGPGELAAARPEHGRRHPGDRHRGRPRLRPSAEGRRPHGARRLDGRPPRPQRRRQDHPLRRDQRPAPPDRRHRPPLRPGRHQALGLGPFEARHVADLPDHPCHARTDRRREPARRRLPAHQAEHRTLPARRPARLGASCARPRRSRSPRPSCSASTGTGTSGPAPSSSPPAAAPRSVAAC